MDGIQRTDSDDRFQCPYRQQSVATDEQLAVDPGNRLLGRGPRFRLPAEFIRDQALAVSGLLATCRWTECLSVPAIVSGKRSVTLEVHRRQNKFYSRPW